MRVYASSNNCVNRLTNSLKTPYKTISHQREIKPAYTAGFFSATPHSPQPPDKESESRVDGRLRATPWTRKNFHDRNFRKLVSSFRETVARRPCGRRELLFAAEVKAVAAK